MRYTILSYSAAARHTRCAAADAVSASAIDLDRAIDVRSLERLVAVVSGHLASSDVVDIQEATAWALGLDRAGEAGSDEQIGGEIWTVFGWWIDVLETAAIQLHARSGQQAIAAVMAAAGTPSAGMLTPLRVAAAVRGAVVPVLTLENLPAGARTRRET